MRAAAAAPDRSRLTCSRAPAAKKLADRAPDDPPAFVGPLSLGAGAAWEAELSGLTLDDYHFIYVCKRQPQKAGRK